MHQSFATGATRSAESRLSALTTLDKLVREHESELLGALHEDLGKSAAEGWLSELALVRGAIRDLTRRVPSFVKLTKAKVPLVQRPGRASVERAPLGCCLVIAPWNYPVQLLLIPTATALAAGNVVIAKPSELAPATSALLAKLSNDAFDPGVLQVVEGDGTLTQELIAAGVDHVFFTGSTSTGRAVLQGAALKLTPVTLELGGKSPAFVDRDADLGLAARRIAFAKFLNAGQSCVAPDYVLAHRAIADALVGELGKAIERFFGESPLRSEDFGRIINDGHLERINALLASHGGRVIVGGQVDAGQRYIAPTVIVDPETSSPLMREEIFGPVLPVVRVDGAKEAVRFVADRPPPLAIYCFTNSKSTMRLFELGTSSGSISQNTAAEHFALMSLPFGGVGESGMGAYHAGAGLEAFTHPRSHFARGSKPEQTLAYPPITPRKLSLLRRALRA